MFNYAKISAFFVSLTVLFVSCGWESNGPEYLQDAYEISAPCLQDIPTNCSQNSDVTVSNQPATSITGRWAIKVEQRGTTNAIGEDWPLEVTNWVIADIPSDGTGVFFMFCDQFMDTDTTSPLKPVSKISQNMKDALISVFVPFDGPSLNVFPKLDVLWLWGLRNMNDPLNDPLPTKPDDPNVWDQDQDGNPGVTMNIIKPIKGDRYMVRRGIWHIEQGTPDNDFLWIHGVLTFKIDMATMGATDPILKTAAPIKAGTKNNSYIMRRVPGNFTCQDLMTHVDKVFVNPPNGFTSGE